MRFKGKVVLVTGSSRGIGEAILREFVKEGAKVVLNYFNSKKDAEKVLLDKNTFSGILPPELLDEIKLLGFSSNVELDKILRDIRK